MLAMVLVVGEVLPLLRLLLAAPLRQPLKQKQLLVLAKMEDTLGYLRLRRYLLAVLLLSLPPFRLED